MEYLKQWSQKHDWHKYVIYEIKAYNISVHEGTEYTPHELVFGKSARVPVAYYQTIRAMNHIPNTHYSNEYSTSKHQHARTSNMQKLGLSDTTIVKQTHRYSTRMNIYICQRNLRDKFDEKYKRPYKIKKFY